MPNVLPTIRKAYIIGTDVDQIEAYLPSNYKVALVCGSDTIIEDAEGTRTVPPGVVVTGYDNAGWTMDGYVLPRLGSGLHFGVEIF